MEEAYIGRKSKRLPLFLLGVIALLLISGFGVFVWTKGSSQIVSPVPAQPDFQVIFVTPTLAPVSPTSTPSATPKVKKTAPSATPKPTAATTGSISPTKTSVSVTPTAKPSPSPTSKP